MSDQITPTNQEAPASAPRVGKPSQAKTSEAGGQSQQASAAQGLTLEQITSAFKGAMTEIQREQQSQRDKLEARLNSKVNQMVQAATSAGVTLTQEQIAKARETLAIAETQETDPAPDLPGQAERTTSDGNQNATQADPITKIAHEVMDDEGIDIDANDPEAAMIDWSNKAAARRTTLQAIEEKRRRTAVGSLPVGGGQPSGKPQHADWTGQQTLEAAFKQMKF